MFAPRRLMLAGVIAIVAGLLPTSFAVADTWLTVDQAGVVGLEEAVEPVTPDVKTLDLGLSGLQVSVDTRGLVLDWRNTDAGDFVALTLPDEAVAGEIGAPGVPLIRRLLVVGDGAKVTVTAQTGEGYVVDGVMLGGQLRLLPVQPPIEKIPGARENAEFIYDEVAYAQDVDYAPQRATVTELGIVRGQRLFLLEIWPISYNPVAEQITFWTNIVVDVQIAGGNLTTGMSPFPGLSRVVLNPDLISTTSSRGTGNYLIIVCTSLESEISAFANAKAGQGFSVSTHTVTDGTANSTIKSYIEGLWGGPDSPDYILLVGDTNLIPHWVGGGAGSPDTDLQYACMDGVSDWYPDIAIGRFPARTAAQLQAMIDKTLYYENGPLADPDYKKRAVFMAGNDNYDITEGTHNYVINNYMIPNEYEYDMLYEVTYGATTADVSDSFNDGRFFGIFSGHGASTYWDDGPTFSQSNVNALVNTNMYAFVCSFSCSTGDYANYDECFMETWVRAPNKGAVTSWGSSVSSYWDEDDILEKRLFDAIFDEEDDVVCEVGPIYNESKMRFLAHYGANSTTQRYFEMYNLMGDPSLLILGESEPPHGMRVSPSSALESEGQVGGPFSPNSIAYTVENMNESGSFSYEVTKTQSWVTITDGTGTLAPQETAVVTVSINSSANSLGDGQYSDTVQFTNTTDHDGDTTRDVTLTVGVASLQYAWNMDSDPNWTTAGQWAWGQPAGSGGADHGNPDPGSGYTGGNVYGYNLNGDYTNGMSETHLTSTAIDCSELTEVSLKFYRWLNVETNTYDHAYVRVSNDGSNWTTPWQNSSQVTDSAWSQYEYDISSVADNQATVYLRWTMGTTDSSWLYSGWNIDDVEIWGLAPSGPVYSNGDLNCDGSVNSLDVDPYVLALNSTPPDYPEYYAEYPDCNAMLADCNSDGSINSLDIDPFVDLLTGG